MWRERRNKRKQERTNIEKMDSTGEKRIFNAGLGVGGCFENSIGREEAGAEREVYVAEQNIGRI